MKRLTVKRVADMLREKDGNVSASARELKVTRQAVANYINRHSVLASILTECRATMADEAESAIYKAIKEGSFVAAKWYLSWIG